MSTTLQVAVLLVLSVGVSVLFEEFGVSAICISVAI